MNKELALRTLDAIRADKSRWNQEYFANACGTQLCFAGHAAVQAGARLEGNLFLLNDKAIDASRFAENQLGLTDEQASSIFYYIVVDAEGREEEDPDFDRSTQRPVTFEELEARVKSIFELS